MHHTDRNAHTQLSNPRSKARPSRRSSDFRHSRADVLAVIATLIAATLFVLWLGGGL